MEACSSYALEAAAVEVVIEQVGTAAVHRRVHWRVLPGAAGQGSEMPLSAPPAVDHRYSWSCSSSVKMSCRACAAVSGLGVAFTGALHARSGCPGLSGKSS